MRLPVHWVDAFTDKVFGGNPAAVVEVQSWPEDTLLQRIALENGTPATAFFRRSGPARAELKWFTPTRELGLCGHGTLATSHVLFEELGNEGACLVFETKAGTLEARRRESLVEISLPATPGSPATPSESLLKGLVLVPSEVLRTENAWVCVFARTEDVEELKPDHATLSLARPGRIIVTAPGRDCDFVSRFFAPELGIPEDPVTGSAHCALVPYWSPRLAKGILHARQVSARRGELWCTLEGDRVRLAGRCAPYLQGSLTV